MPGQNPGIFPLEHPSREPHNNQVPPSGKIYQELESLSFKSDFLICSPISTAERRLERYIFEGPNGGGDAIRIGVFAGIHGDEAAGPWAVLHILQRLTAQPNIGEGYELYFYPVCNPTGFEAGARFSTSGKDLNREFWKDSSEPEVLLLEKEIRNHAFQGLISFHADDTSKGLYGFVRGALLAKSLLEPALTAAESVLPRNRSSIIDGFPAENGIISQCYDGILTSPPKLQGSPFEIILETPQHAPHEAQINACVAATLSVLGEYRKFISFAADL